MAAAGLAQLREAFEDVALRFTRTEWELLGDGDKGLYRDQMLRNYRALVSLDQNYWESGRYRETEQS
ncbi:hypothetical protein Y1Q_0011185 [Alligator mississippiensis]|uniref:KRAB domain-containing protein n=1 Tax=Alligator mississippiensis TaxID=8496 RepID=A0A151MRY0_ALLMI|nr:hypothetical protein Y1Q_0011185 [Alligator mississippiensis]